MQSNGTSLETSTQVLQKTGESAYYFIREDFRATTSETSFNIETHETVLDRKYLLPEYLLDILDGRHGKTGNVSKDCGRVGTDEGWKKRIIEI